MFFFHAWRTRRIQRLLPAVADSLPDPPPSLLRELTSAWGNKIFAADFGYLQEVVRHAAATPGPILECGCGLTTLLLGMIADRHGKQVWSLEHLPKWHARVGQVLERCGIQSVRLLLTPLRDFGGYSWYDVPRTGLPGRFSLVICDGPPGRTRGGRYGLLPQMKLYLDADTVILLDDAAREGDRQVLDRWVADFGVQFNLQPTNKDGLAVVRLPSASAQAAATFPISVSKSH